jgi:hypothetical protein
MRLRAAVFLLATSATAGLAIALLAVWPRLAASSEAMGLGAVTVALLVAAAVLWLPYRSLLDRKRLVGAFVVPVLVAAGSAPISAATALALRFVPGVELWRSLGCVLGVVLAYAMLRHSFRRGVLSLLVALGLTAIIGLLPLPPTTVVADPVVGLGLSLSASWVSSIGFAGALGAGMWAAAFHPEATAFHASARRSDPVR